MKIAMPIMNRRIAPRVGMAITLLIVDVERGVEVKRKTVSLSEMHPFEKIRYIKQEGVNILICLGIEMVLYNYLITFGLQVISGVQGSAEEILDLYLSRRLSPGPQPGQNFRFRARRGHFKRYI